MVKVMRMGVGALAFAAMDAFGHEAMEYVQDEQARVTKRNSPSLHGGRRKSRHGSKRDKNKQKQSRNAKKDDLATKSTTAAVAGEQLEDASEDTGGANTRPIAEVDSEDHSDVIFLVGEDPDVQRIPAHSWVLADNSPVFRALFRGPWATTTSALASNTAGEEGGGGDHQHHTTINSTTSATTKHHTNRRSSTTSTNEFNLDNIIATTAAATAEQDVKNVPVLQSSVASTAGASTSRSVIRDNNIILLQDADLIIEDDTEEYGKEDSHHQPIEFEVKVVRNNKDDVAETQSQSQKQPPPPAHLRPLIIPSIIIQPETPPNSNVGTTSNSELVAQQQQQQQGGGIHQQEGGSDLVEKEASTGPRYDVPGWLENVSAPSGQQSPTASTNSMKKPGGSTNPAAIGGLLASAPNSASTASTMNISPNAASGLVVGGPVSKATIAVSDVDGRAFDILLRYLYNETVNLQSVMTALTTLYAAHKYMCPGLAKQVVRYLKDNLTEKNVLLVLQHICLYCSSATSRSSNSDWLEDDIPPPITVGPKRGSSGLGGGGGGGCGGSSSVGVSRPLASVYETDCDPAALPSAPPLPTISENEEESECHPLLDEDDFMLLEADDEDKREFEAGMTVSGPKGRKVNCCDDLLKQCLELIDKEAGSVLASEDVEDLDISALNMILCRDTLRLGPRKGEVEVFQAVQRWSTRECKRQRLELTSENRRRVLEGAQYFVRYLTMNLEDYKAGPYKSGLLTSEEAEAVLNTLIGATSNEAGASAHAAFDLPDHLMHWQTIWKKPRTASPLTSYKKSGGPWSPFARSTSSIIRQDPLGPNGGSGANRSRAASRMGPPYPSGISLDKSRQGSLAVCNSGGAPLLDEPATNHSRFSNNTKEKFNFIEEFFICLACIFD